MADKSSGNGSSRKGPSGNGPSRNDSAGDGARRRPGKEGAAINTYLKAHKKAGPHEVAAALRKDGVRVSPETVSVILAKAGVKRARREANAAVASQHRTADDKVDYAQALEAALLLYKAASGRDTPSAQIREAFLMLVDVLD